MSQFKPGMTTVSLTTTSGGSASYTTDRIDGFLHEIVLDVDALTNGQANVSITGAITGRTFFARNDSNVNATVRPRGATHDTGGVASLYAAGGEPVESLIAICEPLTIAITDGGDTKAATIYLIAG